METGMFSADFSRAFDRLLKETKVSCYQIGKYAQLDEAYLSRLRRGEKNNPSPLAILKIGLAFAHLSPNVKLQDIEELFNSVGRSIMPK
jgi:hypothetical protein